MTAYVLTPAPASLLDQQHVPPYGNGCVFAGYVDGSQAASSGGASDTLEVDLITLPAGSHITEWSLAWSALGATAIATLGFKYKDSARAAGEPHAGSAAYGFPAASATQFGSGIAMTNAGSTSGVVLGAPFWALLPVVVYVSITGTASGGLLPAASKLSLLMKGIAKGTP